MGLLSSGVVGMYFITVFLILEVSCSSSEFLRYRQTKENLKILKQMNDNQYDAEETPNATEPDVDLVHDFIIVGGGSAGCALAARLSEIPHVSVLLLEAGDRERLVYDVPVAAVTNQFTKINWQYTTESSDRYCLGMIDNKCSWARGKVLGGTSVLNYMQAGRGFIREYKEWADLGNEGWSYGELTPYFKKLENIEIPEFRNDTVTHNTRGPIHISYPIHETEVARAFLRAGQELGYGLIDYNGHPGVGFSKYQTTISGGLRMSSNRAYLDPIRYRKNLRVSLNSVVSKILIDSNNRAYGVEFQKNRKTYRVFAVKEIIVSAGTVASPQILMLSGIGRAKHLEEMGIRVVKDAPVGKNLMDHVGYAGLAFALNESVGFTELDAFNPGNVADFLLNRNGIFTLPQGGEAMGYVDVDSDTKQGGDPNIEFFFFSAAITASPIVCRTLRIRDEIWKKYFRGHSNKPSWSILPMLMYPKSRGEILLRSKDINVHPKIVPNYMDHPDDVRLLIKGIRKSIEISQTEAMRKYDSRLIHILYDECSHYVYDSDSYWHCALRLLAIPNYHFAGTCKMAAEDDVTAVVNPRLQVIGIKGLRVADASIMPTIVGAHTNIPTITIAEKAADMIKTDWGYPTEPLS